MRSETFYDDFDHDGGVDDDCSEIDSDVNSDIDRDNQDEGGLTNIIIVTIRTRTDDGVVSGTPRAAFPSLS